MDISESYIKMCGKAGEIQKMWKPSGGDWYLHDFHGSTGFSKDQENQIWSDKKEKWERIEILCYQPDDEKNYFVSTDGNKSHITSAKDLLKHRCIWLPRQDQLQEMLEDYSGRWINYFGKLWEFCREFLNHTDGLYMGKFSSPEQLWLVFVMKEKFGKVWDGNEWITI